MTVVSDSNVRVDRIVPVFVAFVSLVRAVIVLEVMLSGSKSVSPSKYVDAVGDGRRCKCRE